MGFYKFDRDDAFRFANFIGAETRVNRDELTFLICPYCHGSMRSDQKKFSINLNTGVFNCFRSSCGAHGNMLTLARDFGFKINNDVERYYNLKGTNDRFRTFKKKDVKVKPAAVKYLESRGISEKICKEYEITTKKDADNILVFPFKDPDGVLRFIKYRNTEYVKDVTNGSKEWCEADCMPILFGMNKCTGAGTLIITEGQIDSLSLSEVGIPNAVSVPTGKNGFTWVPHCWDFLQKYQKIIVFGDNENGVITLSEQIKARFPKVTYTVRPEDYQGYKDANEILQHCGAEALRKAVNNAEYQSNGRLKDMSTVKRVDVEKVETIKTNIEKLDKILTGGFKVGSVNIITGERGNGKSTLASEFIVEALAQNYNCFIYSGELPDFFVKNWIDRQISGKEQLYNSDIDACEDWYKGRLFVYDNNIFVEDGEELEGLLDTIEEAIVRKNCKAILLDNLMTALDECSTNEQLYMAQSNFMSKLTKIAKKFEVVILLVAHPRKTNGREFINDDVSGSADITNKVDLVMSYDAINDKKDHDHGRSDARYLKVTKNRLTGKTGKITLYFSETSKRINDVENWEKHYLPGSDDFIEPDNKDEEDIPFD